MNNIYRINDYSIMKTLNSLDSREFNVITYNSGNKHYLINSENNINQSVWVEDLYTHRLNKTYSSLPLIDIFPEKQILPITNIEILLRQGYSFSDNVFGLLVNIIESNTTNILYSQILYESDFKISENKELINGSFWLESAIIEIPKFDGILAVEITEVKFSDIDPEGENIGLIYNFPTDFIPLISEKPMPDYLYNYINIDDNFFIEVGLKTTENKTIEKSILDYFDVSIANVEINHLITYGNENLGYKKISLSNVNNIYMPINFGLYLKDWQHEPEVTINLTTEILVDGKLMQRDVSILLNISNILQPYISDNITHPTTNYPVEIIKEEVINQTVINTPEKTNIVKISKKMFVETIKSDIVFDTKLVTFNSITEDCYMDITADNKVQTIDSEKTSEGVVYFDLSTIVPISSDGIFNIREYGTNLLIGEGKITVK